MVAARSTAGDLHVISARAEALCHLVTVVALDLDRAFLDRSAGTAVPLELSGHDLLRVPRQAADDRDRLAAAAALFARHSHSTIFVNRPRLWFGGPASEVTAVRGVHARHASDRNHGLVAGGLCDSHSCSGKRPLGRGCVDG
jgi:hypothetical protein